jgi:hypothetical protein
VCREEIADLVICVDGRRVTEGVAKMQAYPAIEPVENLDAVALAPVFPGRSNDPVTVKDCAVPRLSVMASTDQERWPVGVDIERDCEAGARAVGSKMRSRRRDENYRVPR